MATAPLSSAPHVGTHRPALGRSLGEFLVVGGMTPLLFVASWMLRGAWGLSDAEFWTGFTFFYAAHLLNDPHFAVTYLLFYRDARARAFGDRLGRGQRLRYLGAGLLAPLVLGAWAIAALAMESAPMLGLMFQLMYLLVGWHYVKQGFGVATVLSARRGVRYSRGERWVLLAHCFAGWGYAWSTPFDPGSDVEEKGVYYTTFGQPAWLEHVTLVVFALSAVALVVMLVTKLRREGRLPILTPMMGLLSSIWAWSVFSSIDPLVRYAVPALHSLQYLYFVWLMRQNEATEREQEPYFETSARTRMAILALSALGLGFFLFDAAPSVLDELFQPMGGRAPEDPLGPTPYFAALYTFVNLHHFFMDSVIWRRENPETRYLAR